MITPLRRDTGRVPEHRIVLIDRSAPRGVVAAHSWFPVPRFAARCVCCDARADDRLDFDPSLGALPRVKGRSTGRLAALALRGEHVWIPVCSACRNHVRRSHTAGWLAAIAVGIGLVSMLVGIVATVVDLGAAPMIPIGLAPLMLGIACYVVMDRSRARKASRGHHELDLLIQPGSCAVVTTNAMLAERLLADNLGAKRAR